MTAPLPIKMARYIDQSGRLTVEGMIYFTRMVDAIRAADGETDLGDVEDDIDDLDDRVTDLEALGVPNLDAFGRLRVSEPHTLFDSKQIFDNQPRYWDDSQVSGSGTTSTHSANEAATTIGVASVTAGKRVRQTFQRFNYQPGKSQQFMMTGVPLLSGGGVGIQTRTGAFDDDNGIFAEYDAGAFSFSCRSNFTGTPVDTSAAQSAWNGDKLDGTGASGITLNPSYAQIFWFDMEWLGVGDVRLGFVVDGEFILCHTFHNTNRRAGVYMSTPNLPLRYEIINDGTGAATEMMHICSTVIAEGGIEPLGTNHWGSVGTAFINAATAGTLYAIYGIKLRTAYIGQSISLNNLSLMNTTADDIEWVIMLNPTVAGTFTYADHASSSLQEALGNTTGTNTVTGGHELGGGYIAAGKDGGAITGGLEMALKLGAAIDGTRDEIVLCAKPLSANADIFGGLGWRELT